MMINKIDLATSEELEALEDAIVFVTQSKLSLLTRFSIEASMGLPL